MNEATAQTEPTASHLRHPGSKNRTGNQAVHSSERACVRVWCDEACATAAHNAGSTSALGYDFLA